MTCRDWEERIAAAARDGDPDSTVYQHLVRCPHCLEFAGQTAAVAAALANWEVPAPAGSAAEASRAALAERLAAIRKSSPGRPEQRLGFRILDQPAAIAVAGAAAMAAGAAAAPGWVRWALVCWAALAALVVSVVLLHYGRQDMTEGEY
jgi:hypothetical protein